MNDFYTEQLVKKQTTMKDTLIKAGLVAAAIVSVTVALLFPFGIIIPVVVIAVDVLMFRRLNVEYEYLFVNGDLDIDKIMSKAKRKRVFSVNVADLEMLAPVDAPQIQQFQNAKVSDYSSGNGGKQLYALVAKRQGSLNKIIFEPNDTIIEGFFILAPRKVVKNC